MADRQTIDTYNKRVREYAEEIVEFWQDFPRTFLSTFTTISGTNVLNVGSGTGADAILLRDTGKEVICLDASEEMVVATTKLGFSSIYGDFSNLPFPEKNFDAVWAYTSLLHIPKSEMGQALSEISRVLKTSGIFALGLIEGDTEEYKKSSGVDLPRFFSFYQKDEVVDLCNTHGFTLVYFEEFKPRSKNYLNFIFSKN